MAFAVGAFLNRRVEAASVVSSLVRADSSVEIRIWNASFFWPSEIFSIAGSSMPSILRPMVCMTRSTRPATGVTAPA